MRLFQIIAFYLVVMSGGASLAQAQWFARDTHVRVLKEVEVARCFKLSDFSDEYIQRVATGQDYDIIEGQYPYQERIDGIVYFTETNSRTVQEKQYSKTVNHIERISLSERLGNEATVKSRMQQFIKIKKAFACKEVEQ